MNAQQWFVVLAVASVVTAAAGLGAAIAAAAQTFRRQNDIRELTGCPCCDAEPTFDPPVDYEGRCLLCNH